MIIAEEIIEIEIQKFRREDKEIQEDFKKAGIPDNISFNKNEAKKLL